MTQDPSSREPTASSPDVGSEDPAAAWPWQPTAEEQAQQIAREALALPENDAAETSADQNAGHDVPPETFSTGVMTTEPRPPGPHAAPAQQHSQPGYYQQGHHQQGYYQQGHYQEGHYQQGYQHTTGYYAAPMGAPVVQARNPALYVLVDFLITGLGLMLQGRALLGVTFLLATIFCLALGWIPFLGWILIVFVMIPVGIISMVLSFTTAKAWNRRHGIIS